MTAKKNGAVRAMTVTTRKNGSGPDKPQVRFHVTAERMAEVEFGILLDIQENPEDVDPRLLAKFLEYFVTDESGEYLPPDEARQAIRKVSIGQIKSAAEQIMGTMTETAVPNG